MPIVSGKNYFEKSGKAYLLSLRWLLLVASVFVPLTAQAQSHYSSCQKDRVVFVKESLGQVKESSTSPAKPLRVVLPSKVGNFKSIEEGLEILKGEKREFLFLLQKRILALAESHQATSSALAACASDLPLCRNKKLRAALAQDKKSIQEQWRSMRLGLALGFPSVRCLDFCVGFEPVVGHLFQWARPFAKPSAMGSKPFSQTEDREGALSFQEASEADALVRKITDPILDRPLTWWDYLSHGSMVAGSDSARLREAARALTAEGPGGTPSFRDQWRAAYFESIRQAPILLFVSNPSPSDREMAEAYGRISENAQNLLDGLNASSRMNFWDYLNLTARDLVVSYHGVAESILREEPKYCGIAERMLQEKISNDSTKFAVVVGSTIASGVGCVLTGGSYVGLSLCALSSLGITAKTTIDAERAAEAARWRAGSSASPSLLVDDYASLSATDREAVLADTLKYFALLDVAILGSATVKLAGKSLVFFQRLNTFTQELSAQNKIDIISLRQALRIILWDAPSPEVVKRAINILSFLAPQSLNQKNAREIGWIARNLAASLSESDHRIWAQKIDGIVSAGEDSLRGFSVVVEEGAALVTEGNISFGQALKRSSERQISRVSWEKDRLLSNLEKDQLRKQIWECLENSFSSQCTEAFARVGRWIIGSNGFEDKNLKAVAIASQAALGRSLSTKELKSLVEARKLGSLDSYTPEEILQQNRILQKSGVEESEILQLRRQGLLGNWVKETLGTEPKQVAVLETTALERTLVEKVRSGQKIFYAIDDLDNLTVSPKEFDLSGETALLVLAKDGAGNSVPVRVKEAGTMVFDGVSQKMEFRPTYGNSFSHSEKTPFLVKQNPNLQQTKVLSCLEILQGRQSGKGFVLQSIMGDNVVMTGAILSGEAMGANRLSSPEGREVVLTDYQASNAAWIVNAFLRRELALKKINFASYAATRLPANFLLIEMQREIFRANLQEDGEKRSATIRNYNLGWMLARFPVSFYFDRYLLNTLPLQLFSACSKGAKTLQIVFHPGMVAIYDKAFTAIFYYQGRKLIAGE